MKNKMIINGCVILVAMIMITTIFTGCNIGNQVITDGTEKGDVSSNSELTGDESVKDTASEIDTEMEIDTETKIDTETEVDAETEMESETETETETNIETETEIETETQTESETAGTEVPDSPSSDSSNNGNVSSSDTTTGNDNSANDNDTEGNTGKVDVSDIVLADGERLMYAISAVYVRSYKSMDSEILGTLSAGEAVVVVEKSYSGWEKIKYGSGYGYVASKFLEGDEEDSEEVVVDDKYQNYLEEVPKLAQQVLDSIIKPSMSDFEKLLAIHDWLTHNVVYDYDNYYNGTIPWESTNELGALRDKRAVCSGYAAAFQTLARSAGFEVRSVSGTATNLLGPGAHEWNQVKLDGIWYNIDVTWDDPGWEEDTIDNCCYNYFLVSDEYFYQDHTPYFEAETCLYTYDRRTVCEAAIKSGRYGNNVAYVESAEEATAAVNAFGKADINEIEIWIYDPSGEGFEKVSDGVDAAQYPNIDGMSGSGSGDFYRCFIELMTEKDIAGLPVVTNGTEYVEMINAMFDTGITSFRFIFDHSGNPDNSFGYSPDDLRYEFENEILESYNNGRCFIEEMTLIGEK